jgi:diadenylate cyclase
MGALIVLEQDTGLRNFMETGTFINGQLTKELIESIFYNKSPLHDGAVIIQKSRLIAAGCLLPLSNNPGISKILGTRHRAAVGLTEISDALVVVVSEETGMVSLAKDGKLEWGISLDKLNQLLVYHYRKKVKIQRNYRAEYMNFKEWIKEDWQLKILALFMGLILWFYVVKIAKVKLQDEQKPPTAVQNTQETSDNLMVK